MIIFPASDFYKRFTKPLSKHPGVKIGNSEIERFSNHELYARALTKVDGSDCLIVGSLAPPDKQLMGLCMLADALKHAGASSVSVFSPYLGYGRQDKFQPNESRGIQLVGSWIVASGINKLITVDAHSVHDQDLIGLSLVSLSPASIFTPEIRKLGWRQFTVVAPDEGAINRAENLADSLGQNVPIAHFVKQRTNEVMHLKLVGEVSPKVIIVDDILDTGKTLISACTELQNRGVKEIAVAVTHGLFTGHDWKRIFQLGVMVLMVSDSTPEAVEESEHDFHIKLLPLALRLPELVESLAERE